MRWLICIALLLAHPAWAGDARETVGSGRNERFFLVHTPPQYAPGKSLPAVLVLHGGGGAPGQTAVSTGMNAVADRHGFIAVYPAGTGISSEKLLTWNAGRCCGRSVKRNVDDVGYISRVIDALVSRYHADAKRIYVTGHSNGSMMSYRLGCQLSEKIAAIAPVAGQSVFEDCRPARAVPTLHIHGTADQCARYEGGEACGGCFTSFLSGLGVPMKQESWPCEAVQEQIVKTATRNGCSATRTPAKSIGSGTCEKFDGCPAGAEVEICTIEGGGHAWPGGAPAAFCTKRPKGRACRKWREEVGDSPDFPASETIWQFFSQHRLP